jgi:putative ABC transport system ATP-binding protein
MALERRLRRIHDELERIMSTNTTDPKITGVPSPPLYRLEHLTKVYGSERTEVRAVDEIDLEIAPGEFVVIVGPSGSGKSTLLQLLGALDRASGGAIEFEGRDLSGLGDRDLADLRLRTLGFIFQQFNLIPTLNARENVEVAMAPTGISGTDRARSALEALERVGLQARAEHLPSELSGGEQQRVAIARALANGPDVLLADEPTGNLDTKTGEAILSLLYHLWREHGLTVVLITHDPAIAAEAPRVVHLGDGRITSDSASSVGADTPERPLALQERSKR